MEVWKFVDSDKKIRRGGIMTWIRDCFFDLFSIRAEGWGGWERD